MEKWVYVVSYMDGGVQGLVVEGPRVGDSLSPTSSHGNFMVSLPTWVYLMVDSLWVFM